MQGFLALMEAIDRAGSTDPAKIQAALRSQDLKPEQLMIGYNGVKYDAKGQNMLAATLLVQLDGPKYVAVWPDKSAVHPPVAPFKGWT
jgi:branched-chain amino acid transport system substrate-binding protein